MEEIKSVKEMSDEKAPVHEEKHETRQEQRPVKVKRVGANDNIVFVGKKPTMSYVLAVITQFSSGASEVHLKARGKSISMAVDVAEVVKNRFSNSVKNIVEIGTERVQGDRGELNVSTIEITLSK
jgi:archaea-specific DNA-binding protein